MVGLVEHVALWWALACALVTGLWILAARGWDDDDERGPR